MISVTVRVGLGGAAPRTINVAVPLDEVRRQLEEDLSPLQEISLVDSASPTRILAEMELHAVVTNSPAKVLAELERTMASNRNASGAATAEFEAAVAALGELRDCTPTFCEQVLHVMTQQGRDLTVVEANRFNGVGEAIMRACGDRGALVPCLLARPAEVPLGRDIATEARLAVLAALVEHHLDEVPESDKAKIAQRADEYSRGRSSGPPKTCFRIQMVLRRGRSGSRPGPY